MMSSEWGFLGPETYESMENDKVDSDSAKDEIKALGRLKKLSVSSNLSASSKHSRWTPNSSKNTAFHTQYYSSSQSKYEAPSRFLGRWPVRENQNFFRLSRSSPSTRSSTPVLHYAPTPLTVPASSPPNVPHSSSFDEDNFQKPDVYPDFLQVELENVMLRSKDSTIEHLSKELERSKSQFLRLHQKSATKIREMEDKIKDLKRQVAFFFGNILSWLS